MKHLKTDGSGLNYGAPNKKELWVTEWLDEYVNDVHNDLWPLSTVLNPLENLWRFLEMFL